MSIWNIVEWQMYTNVLSDMNISNKWVDLNLEYSWMTNVYKCIVRYEYF
jgi:hypothetical protein